MDWFERLVGFRESAEAVASQLKVEGTTLVSAANNRRFEIGDFSTPSLAEARSDAKSAEALTSGSLSVSEVIAGVGALHRDPSNAGALFQVASQFNLLEMVSPEVTPAAGVTGYANDHTQGPACAIACGAATIYRNWFVPIDGSDVGHRGQAEGRQLDMLADVGQDLGNRDGSIWTMRNGYALAAGQGLDELPDTHELLRVGVHFDAEVTAASSATVPGHRVSQIFCSALPVAYTRDASADELEPLARMILRSSYAATLAVARRNAARTGNPTVFLTMVGGGVFGNPSEWIVDAMARAFDEQSDAALDVRIVSHSTPNPAVASLLR